MSFTEDVKNEIAHVERLDASSRRAELLGLLRMSGTFITGAHGKWGISFSTGNNAVARRVLAALKKDYHLQPAAMVRQGRKLRKKNVYTLVIDASPEGQKFMEELHLSPFAKINDHEFLQTMEERKAYLAGAFLGGGSVSRPQSDYHLEMVTQSNDFADEIVKVIKKFHMKAKVTERKGAYVVYAKGGDDVSSFLQIIGAGQGFMNFESVRVMKDMRNLINRQVNFETANLQKTVDAALRQTHACRELLSRSGAHSLSPKIRETCEARLANPQASMTELAEELQISKSGLAHRFEKIISLVRYKNNHSNRRS